MKSGYPTLNYNTQVIVTRSDQTIVTPENTLRVADTIFLRSDFIPSNPPSIKDLPELQTKENPFTTRKEVMDSLLNSFGYNTRRSLRRFPAFYVARKFTNSSGFEYAVRLSYHIIPIA